MEPDLAGTLSTMTVPLTTPFVGFSQPAAASNAMTMTGQAGLSDDSKITSAFRSVIQKVERIDGTGGNGDNREAVIVDARCDRRCHSSTHV
jgi:hypothetical protein